MSAFYSTVFALVGVWCVAAGLYAVTGLTILWRESQERQ